ncbi:ribosome-associated heat shock protein Hsp15 [Humitalea rosea]|uniref:Ribosome-associated heat shock protein Hsp15 n=1 Tax=Humitalea rosea TaxID=990373 RepID=A0A2W7HYB7_9PROT|nr:S4 domain-containing protein [Humitalea rosea]PZW38929.1 ribosome-associated heat shock protein Hsp15 [Humitalea rosea]
MTEPYQRLDFWLWCARVARNRADCAKLVEKGRVRLNRQSTDKPHAKLRPGDTLTIALGGNERGVIRIWTVLALAKRRGPASEARALYDDLSDAG